MNKSEEGEFDEEALGEISEEDVPEKSGNNPLGTENEVFTKKIAIPEEQLVTLEGVSDEELATKSPDKLLATLSGLDMNANSDRIQKLKIRVQAAFDSQIRDGTPEVSEAEPEVDKDGGLIEKEKTSYPKYPKERG